MKGLVLLMMVGGIGWAQTAPYQQLPATTNYPTLATVINGKANVNTGSGAPTTAVCNGGTCTAYLDWYVDTSTNNLWVYTGVWSLYQYGTTFTNTEHTASGCQFFPDTNYSNVDVSAFPLDYGSSTYIAAMTLGQISMTAATWSGGTVTATLTTTTGISNGGTYQITGTNPSGYSNTLSTGPNSWAFIITVIDGTHISYSVTSNPGTYVNGGTFWVNNANRFGTDPAMYLNVANNSTITPATSTTGAFIDSDVGAFPITGTMQTEGYTYGSPNACAVSTGGCGGDNHLIVLNSDTCMLYEADGLNNSSAPYSFDSIAIWNLKSNVLRTNYTNLLWYGNDDTGLTSADVAGAPIWPLTFTHAEIYSGSHILHPGRITFPQTLAANQTFTWPATHGAGAGGGSIPIGVRMILNPSYPYTTCQHFGNIGQSFSSYTPIVNFMWTLQHYGVIFADFGFASQITVDADQAWGDPNAIGVSDDSIMNGWMHCFIPSDFVVVRETPTQGSLNGAAK